MLTWSVKFFDNLKPAELYRILQLRNEVFVVEQNCVFQDADDKDPFCHHLMGWENDALAAYSRIVPQMVAYPDYPSIGRVVTSPATRKTGVGRLLMQRSILEVKNLYGDTGIKLGAQYYLKSFYESFGFSQTSEIYLEDGIPHIEMMKPESDQPA
ncbi:MAG TPA: GNAT family N-acetyltransferase [Chitinophagaceae bacterium]